MTMKVIIPPFDMIMVKGKVELNTCSKCINIMIKPTVRDSKHVARSLPMEF